MAGLRATLAAKEQAEMELRASLAANKQAEVRLKAELAVKEQVEDNLCGLLENHKASASISVQKHDIVGVRFTSNVLIMGQRQEGNILFRFFSN